MMFKKRRWIVLFSVCAVLAVIFRFTDTYISKLFYYPNNVISSICENIISTFPFYLCSFCFATFMFCRKTLSSRKKTRFMNFFYGFLSFAFASMGAYYPYIHSKEPNFIIILVVGAVISITSMYINAGVFKEYYQKTQMMTAAKVGIISSLVVIVLCVASSFIPNRVSYFAIQEAIEIHGDGSYAEGNLSILSLTGAATGLFYWTKYLTRALPELKYSSNPIFIICSSLIFVIYIFTISGGNCYSSEFVYGLFVSLLVQFVVSKIFSHRKKKHHKA